jgi:hypothetical protein
MSKSTPSTMQLVDALTASHGLEVSASQVQSVADSFGITYITASKKISQYKSGRGKWNFINVDSDTLPRMNVPDKIETTVAPKPVSFVPAVVSTFVPFGNFPDIKKIIRSNQFYPLFITGLSGNGKTFGVEQACAQLDRELIRINITIETDEDDLLGGFRLQDGNTVWHNGPVVEALERGAVLLLDEVDLASNKIMCLQSILEGSGVFLKKIGRYVQPAAGFNVIATANTKGKGSEDGRFIGTNVLNEAFLERFPVTFEQSYPTPLIESKILLNLGCDTDFTDHLVRWAGIIRKTFFDGGVDEVITTRRLVHIVEAYKIFGDRQKSIEVCVNRFDEDTKQSFIELYSKVDDLEGLEPTDSGTPVLSVEVPQD